MSEWPSALVHWSTAREHYTGRGGVTCHARGRSVHLGGTWLMASDVQHLESRADVQGGMPPAIELSIESEGARAPPPTTEPAAAPPSPPRQVPAIDIAEDDTALPSPAADATFSALPSPAAKATISPIEIAEDDAALPSPAAEAVFSLAPSMRLRPYAFNQAEYSRRFDATSGPLPFFPPPVQSTLKLSRHKGVELLPSTHATPFVSVAAGSLPHGTPSCTSELIGTYLVGGAARAPPNIDIDFESVECSSNGEARRALAGAAAASRPFWAAVHVPGIQHPSWWPATAVPVPGFEHMIVGAADAGIGMHRDRYLGSAAGEVASAAGTEASERLVSTYLALGRGRKHVILLPPSREGTEVAEALGGTGCDDAYGRQRSQRVKLPARPPPELLARVLSAGGYWFDLEASRATGDAEGSEAEGDGDDDDEEREVAAEESDEETESDNDDDEEEPTPMALFIPAGWYHWLVGDSQWHVAWSGSIFPGSRRANCELERGQAAGTGKSRGSAHGRGGPSQSRGRGSRRR